MRFAWIFVAVLLLVSFTYASNWTLDGNSVYWTSNGYTIRAYPATSNELINHVQYVNFTSTNPAAILVNLSFVFDRQPTEGDVQLWQNMPHNVQNLQTDRLSALYAVNNVISYSASSLPCQLGDAQNNFNYNITYQTANGTLSGIACFDSFTQNGNNYTLNYSYNFQRYVPAVEYWMDWGSILGSFNYTGVAGKHAYTIYNVPFNGSTHYATKFSYSFPIRSSGKFNIYAHGGSPTDVVAGFAPIFVELDPWWNANWTYKVPITITTGSGANILRNFTARVMLNTSNTTLYYNTSVGCGNIRFVDSTETHALPFDINSNSSTYCGNASNNATYWVTGNYSDGTVIYAYLGNRGAANGENELLTWSLASYNLVLHNEETTGALVNMLRNPNMSLMAGTTALNGGRIGNGTSTNGTTYYTATNAGMLNYENGSFSVTYWVKPNPTCIASSFCPTMGKYTSSTTVGQGFINSIVGNGSMGVFLGTGFASFYSAYNFKADIWHHFGLVVNATAQAAIYANGSTSSAGLRTKNVSSDQAFTLFRDGIDPNVFNGSIDEIRIRNASSSNDWIRAEYGQNASVGAITGGSFVIFQAPTPNDGAIFKYSSLNFSANATGFNAALLYINQTAYAMTCNLQGATWNCTRAMTMPEGNSSFYIHAYNSTVPTQNSSTETRTLVVDTLPPSGVSIVSPINKRFYYQNATINMTYSDSSPTSCWFFINNTNISVAARSTSCVYQLNNSAGNFSVVGYIKDFVNFTTASSNISFYTFNYSMSANYTNPQYDLIPYTNSLIINTTNYFGNITSNLEINGVNSSSALIVPFNFSLTTLPNPISADTNVTFKYFATFTNASLIVFIPYNVTIYPAGIVQCGGVSNASTLKISVYDELTNQPVTSSISIFAAYNGSTKTFSASNTSASTWTLCIYPNISIMATNTLTIAASGYYTRIIYDTADLTNAITNKSYYLLNSSVGYPVTLKVQQVPNIAIPSVPIKIYRYSAPSNYTIIEGCSTDAGGQCVVHLIPNTIQYLYNFTANGASYSFGAETVTCSATSCIRTFTIGLVDVIPIFLTNSLSGSCYNISNSLICNATDTSGLIKFYKLELYNFGNSTPICSTTHTGSSTSLNCTVPSAAGSYAFQFWGDDGNQVYVLSGGTFIHGLLGVSFGRDGWIAALLMFGTIGLVAAVNIAMGMVFGVFALFIALYLGIIPIQSVAVIILFGIGAIAISYRAKV